MNNALLQLLVLAAVAVFLIIRLRNVLGTRDGFEPTQTPPEAAIRPVRSAAQAGDDAQDSDISDHVDLDTPAARALKAMKRAEPSFEVGPFLNGAKSAYEMILMNFERGDISEVRDFLSPEVAQAFDNVIADRQDRGLTTEAQYLGTREVTLTSASFDETSHTAEISVRLLGEMTLAIRNAAGEIVEGDAKTARKQRDTWTFARQMGQDDPNWRLIATG